MLILADNAKIDFIGDFDVFHVKKPPVKGAKPLINDPKYMLPTEETHGKAIGMQYYRKKLCEWVSSKNSISYYELYEDRNESELWDLLSIQNTNNYSEE